jgi:hypothetical protein
MSLWFAGYPKTPGCDVRFGSRADPDYCGLICPVLANVRMSITPCGKSGMCQNRKYGDEARNSRLPCGRGAIWVQNSDVNSEIALFRSRSDLRPRERFSKRKAFSARKPRGQQALSQAL